MNTTAVATLEAEMEAVLAAPSLRRVAAVAALTFFLSVGGLIGWAATTPLERAVLGDGALAAEGRRKTITLLEPGILRALAVREGETVAAGQVLLRLNVTQAAAVADQARAQFWAQSVRVARLSAEQRDLREMEMPAGASDAGRVDPAVAALLDAETRLFAARWAAYEGSLALHRTRVAQLQEQAAAMTAQRSATATRLDAIRQELVGVNQLFARGFATRTRLWELQRAEAELLGNLGQYQAQEGQTREQIAQAELEVSNLRLTRQQEVATALQDAQAQLADADQRMRGAVDILERREVTAPEAGTVTDIRFFTPGSSIGAGQPVLDLVPIDDRLVAEVRVGLNDIENVHVGQPARLRLSAYRTREVPLIDGHVSYVSADRQQDSQGRQFFLTRVEFDAAQAPPVAAGMPVEAYLLGERRTALDYLLRPLRESLRRSARD